MTTTLPPPLDVSTWAPLEPSYYNPDYYGVINGIKCSTAGNIPFKIQNYAQWTAYVDRIGSDEQIRQAWLWLLRGCLGYCTFTPFLPTSQDYQMAETYLKSKARKLKSNVYLQYKEK